MENQNIKTLVMLLLENVDFLGQSIQHEVHEATPAELQSQLKVLAEANDLTVTDDDLRNADTALRGMIAKPVGAPPEAPQLLTSHMTPRERIFVRGIIEDGSFDWIGSCTDAWNEAPNSMHERRDLISEVLLDLWSRTAHAIGYMVESALDALDEQIPIPVTAIAEHFLAEPDCDQIAVDILEQYDDLRHDLLASVTPHKVRAS